MAFYRDHLLIGHSRLRKATSGFSKLNILEKKSFAGITVVPLPLGKQVARFEWQQSVDEIFDIQILPDTLWPIIPNTFNEEHPRGLSTPNSTFWAESTHKQLNIQFD